MSQKTSVHLPPTKKRQRPPKRPSLDLKRHPRWNEYERYYALPGPPQEGLLIRHAPIPLPGSPWPMPQDMTMNTDMLRLTQNFQIRIVTQSCDVLEFTRDRVRSMIMSQFTEGSESTHKSPGSQHPAQMRALAVTVLSKCSHYPSRHSDESCKCYICYILLLCIHCMHINCDMLYIIMFTIPIYLIYRKCKIIPGRHRYPCVKMDVRSPTPTPTPSLKMAQG